MKKKIPDRFITLFLWGAIFMYAAVCVTLIFNNNIWMDEAFTTKLLRGNVTDIIRLTAEDVHPPLYYLIAKLGQVLFGKSLQAQKIVVIIPVLLTMMLGASKIRKRFGDTVAVLFIMMIGCMPRTFTFAVQIRMYSWALFFVTACGVYAYESYQENLWKDWIVMTMAGLGAAYCHYFALVSVACIYLLLLSAVLSARRNLLKKWLLMGLFTVIAYLPWLFILLKQFQMVSKSYWIPEIDASTVVGYIIWVFATNITGSSYMYLLLFAAAVAGLVFSCLKNKMQEEIYALLCIMVPFLTTAIGIAVSKAFRPIYYDRYVFPALGLLCLAFAIAMRKKNAAVIVSICAFLCITGIVEYQVVRDEEYRIPHTAETVQFFEKNLGENDIILYNSPNNGFIYKNYWPARQLMPIKAMDFTEDYDSIWYLDTYEGETGLDDSILEENNLQKNYMGNYGIDGNEFEIYRMIRN